MNFPDPTAALEPSALILGNGAFPPDNVRNRIVSSFSSIVCADGGSRTAREMNLLPQAIIGDLDSSDKNDLKYFADRDVRILHRIAQEENDLEKCLRYVLRRKYWRIGLLGFMGDRDDQSIATLQIAKKYCRRAEITFWSETSEFFFLAGMSHRLSTFPGQTVSLFGWPRAFSVSTRGLQFPLVGETLSEGSHGVSNSAVANNVTIEKTRGVLLIVKTGWTI
ncbi:MAG: thiamine diphosphokinase [Candidatus Neomarinimicrobiota bacterium]